jgi:hypothetical protein
MHVTCVICATLEPSRTVLRLAVRFPSPLVAASFRTLYFHAHVPVLPTLVVVAAVLRHLRGLGIN